jgi:hypothetical protein
VQKKRKLRLKLLLAVSVNNVKPINMIDQLEKHLPLVRSLLFDKVLPGLASKGADFLSNDKNLIPILQKVHEMLPFPVRILVKQEDFVRFCLKHKTVLFPNKVEPKKKTTKKVPPVKKAAVSVSKAKSTASTATKSKTVTKKSVTKSKTSTATASKKVAKK